MAEFGFFVPGKPVPKARPRFTRNGHVYTDKKTKEHESLIQWCFQKERLNSRYAIDKSKAVGLKVFFGMPMPKSWSNVRKLKAEQGLTRHTSKPDADNLLKTVMDALNGIAWNDDSQITTLQIFKRYSMEPGTKIEIAGETVNEESK